MPRTAKQSAHAKLEQLRQQAAADRVHHRELETQADAARLEVEQASSAIADGYAADDQRAVSAAREAEETAVAKVKETQHRLAGAEIRVARAQVEADTFQAEHARELLDEKEAEARELAEELTGAGHETVRLHRLYRAIRSDIDSLVAAVPGATSRADGPDPSHPWEEQLRDLERAVRDTPEVPAPLPRCAGLNHRKEQDNANLIERQRRAGELSVEDQAALAIGRVVTVKRTPDIDVRKVA